MKELKNWLQEWYSREENINVRKERYFKKGNKFNNSRKIRNKETGEIYRSMKKASEEINMNYNTVKKYLYNNKDFVLEFYEKEDS